MSNDDHPTKEQHHHPHMPLAHGHLHHIHHPRHSTGSDVIPDNVPLAHGTPIPKTEMAAEPTPTIILLVEEEIDPAVDENAMNENRIKFQDRPKRMKFVTNVLIALGFQFTVCATFMYICKQIESLREFSQTPFGQSVAWIAMILWFLLATAIGCFRFGHGKPNSANICLLIISTLLLAISTAAITVQYNIITIMFAAGTTAGVVLILVIICCCTKLDITKMMVYVIGVIITLIFFSILVSIIFAFGALSWEVYKIQTAISGVVAVIYVILILMHMQLIVGGGAYEYSEDDWLVASIMLFYDILMFFLTILGLIRR